MDSPFLDQSRWIASNDLAAAVRDRYPVSPGHTLIVPQRAVPTVFDCTADEIAAMWRLLEDCKKAIDTEFTPDGAATHSVELIDTARAEFVQKASGVHRPNFREKGWSSPKAPKRLMTPTDESFGRKFQC